MANPTNAQIAQALKALGLDACPVMSATVDAQGTLTLYLVPNPEPVTYTPPKPKPARSRAKPKTRGD
jgi:hypothetical protein